MADLSKIKLDGTTYNLKDTYARNELEKFIHVYGTYGEETGSIILSKEAYGENPYSYQYWYSKQPTLILLDIRNGDGDQEHMGLYLANMEYYVLTLKQLDGNKIFKSEHIINKELDWNNPTIVYDKGTYLKDFNGYVGTVSIDLQTNIANFFGITFSQINNALSNNLPVIYKYYCGEGSQEYKIYYLAYSYYSNSLHYIFYNLDFDTIHQIDITYSNQLYNQSTDEFTGTLSSITIPQISDWARASTKPTYTASEVGAAASNHTHTSIGITGRDNRGKVTTTSQSVEINAYIGQGGESNIILDPGKIKLLASTKSSVNNTASIIFSTYPYEGNSEIQHIKLSDGATTINGVVTPITNDMAANKKYVDDSIATITHPTNISAFNNDVGYLTSFTETDPTVPAWAKAASKPTYTASEVGALPSSTVIPTVPTNISAFNNDAGYLTSFAETDPTVPAWAKAANKPTYTASEVGAVPKDVSSSAGANYSQIYNTPTSVKILNGTTSGSSSLELKGSQLTLQAIKDLSNTSIVLKTNSTNNITLSEGNTTIIGVVTPTSDTMAANKKYVDDAIAGVTDTNTTYTLSMSGNIITLTPSEGTPQTITLPVYNGDVYNGGIS